MELPCLVPRSNILGTLLLLCFVLGFVANNVGVEASHRVYPEWQSTEAVEADPLHRTGYHFQPQKNWINDPNGPMYFKGLYHLFYQYNPNGSVWGNIVWAHSVSKDLINWLPLQPALYPSKPFDINGCWSGSATVLPGDRPVILYTGIDPDNRQVQNYAVPKNPSDPYLREWVKPDDNPIVDPSDGHVNESAFRDPTTAWWDRGHWKITVGSRRKERGMAYLYRSRDFKKWVKAKHPLHSAPRTGMWECPDFYPASMDGRNGLDTSVLAGNLKHVLKVSLDLTRYEYYTLGTYDRKLDRYTPDNSSVDGWKGLRYDYGSFYASKTFFDPSKKRRVLWGWANESDTQQDDVKKGWAGIQLIPRTVVLDESEKQLVQWPIEEVESLRGHVTKMRKRVLNSGDKMEIKGITPAQADVEVTFKFGRLEDAKSIEPFDPSWADLDALDVCRQMGSTVKGGVGPFGLLTLASADLEEYTPVFFRIFKDGANYRVLMCSDARRSSLSPEKPEMYRPPFGGYVDNVELDCGRLSLRTLIDHSVVESFGGGGRTCITSRVYPMKAVGEKAHLFLFNNGTVPITVQRLSAWSMNKPKQMN